LRRDGEDIGDHHKKGIGKGSCWSIKFGLSPPRFMGTGDEKGSYWRCSYGLEHGKTRDGGSSERIWVERAREKRTGDFIEPEWGRGDDSVISLFLLIKLITNYNASRSQPSQLILCSKPSCYYFTALVEYDMYSPL
jgi:hypothetical protein